MLIKMSYQQINLIFSFCNIFSDIDHVFAAHWLKQLEHKLSEYKINEVINLIIYLNSLNILLMNNIIKWAEFYSDAIHLLSIKNFTAQNLTSFKFLLCKRFSSKAIEISFISFNVELFKLQQCSDEALIIFYKRVTNLMQHVKAKDKSTFNSFTILTLLKSAMLNIILRAFIKKISNHIIQRKVIKSMTATDKSLKSIYNLVEKVRWMNLKIQKLFNEKVKLKKLIFYKKLIQKNMFKVQINVLLISYHFFKKNSSIDWSFHEDSSSESRTKQSSSIYSTSKAYSTKSLSLNSNKANQSWFKSRDLLNRIFFKNLYINDIKNYIRSRDEFLCVKCEYKNHINKKCTEVVLSVWKQLYLRSIVFEDVSSISFTIYEFEIYDDAVQSFDIAFTIADFSKAASFNAVMSIYTFSHSASSYFIKLDVESLHMNNTSEVKLIKINYEEEFKSNKKSHVNLSLSSILNSQTKVQQLLFQFQTAENCTRCKEQKCVNKKMKSQSLINMFNDILRRYDFLISIQEILQRNKVNIFFMNLII